MTERRPALAGARILLGVTGGVAAYKAPELTRALIRAGAHVSVLLTRYARRFVTRDALRAVTRGPVLTGLFEPEALTAGPWYEGSASSPLGMAHIGMAREADLVLIAPATANAIGKLAHGLADDLLSTALIATRSPVLIAPAMNVAMWEHAAVQANVRILAGRGVSFVGPEEGDLADGEVGMGRMAAIEAIVAACATALAPRGAGARGGAGRDREALRGRTIVVTAGGTEEPIDPVRVLTNRSSGKMGFAIAEEARAMGADVRLIVARTSAPPPAGVPTTEAMTVAAMTKAVLAAMKDADALVMAAAVSDYAPAAPSARKLARKAEGLTLRLEATEDILRRVRARYPKKRLIGFALETEDELRRGREKMKRKGLDLIAVNNPLRKGSGFGSDDNDVTLIDRNGRKTALGLRPKRDVAREILKRIATLLNR
ncbi:MAG: bifunctional phosphopantothenoylcysteine decarboxylase/phosphopantothenate--cysteine ligase CoaBC [Hyphomicrobiales bacterium]